MKPKELVKIRQEYYGTNTTESQSPLNKDDAALKVFLDDRLIRMAIIKYPYLDRWIQNQNLIDVYLNTSAAGDSYTAAIRFPLAFGMYMRRLAEMVQNPPDTELEAVKRDQDSLASVQAQSHALEYIKDITNFKRERIRMLRDVCGAFGNGWMHTTYRKDKKGNNQVTFYRVDPRDMYVDDAARIFYDRSDERLSARDCFWDNITTISSFLEVYGNDPKYRNTEKVTGLPIDTPISALIRNPTQKELTPNAYTAGQYVHCFYYFNREKNMFAIHANGIPIYSCKLTDEYDHGRLPFSHHRAIARNDALLADSYFDVTYQMFTQNDILNTLMMDNLKLSLQPAWMIDGGLDFNTDRVRIQAGAVLKINGLHGGKIEDSIVPLKLPPLDQNFYQARQMIADEITLATGDDARGLYANPQQLATQTAYKARNLTKLLKSEVIQNEIEAVRDETELIIETVRQFYGKGDYEKMIVPVEGYTVSQNARGKRIPKFVKTPGYLDTYELTPNVFDSSYRVVINSKTEEDEDDADTVQNMITLLNQIVPILQASPDLQSKFDLYSYIYQIAEKMKIDLDSAFPSTTENTPGEADDAIQQILSGQMPTTQVTDPASALQDLAQVINTPTFKNMSAKQKSMLQQYMMMLANGQNQQTQSQQQQAGMQQQTPMSQAPINQPSVAGRQIGDQLGQQANGLGGGGQIANASTAKTIGK